MLVDEWGSVHPPSMSRETVLPHYDYLSVEKLAEDIDLRLALGPELGLLIGLVRF